MNHRSKRRRSGQAMVELLFILVGFMTIVLFVLQLSLIANARSLLNVATYAAARDYAVHRSRPSALGVAKYYSLVGAGLPVANIRISPSNAKFGSKVKVTLTAVYPLRIPLVRQYFGFISERVGLITLNSTVDFTME
jgi:hypothetical protein